MPNISNKQRNTIYMLLKDISLEIHGRDKDIDIMQLRKILDPLVMKENNVESISLSNCSSIIANNYISLLLDLAFEYGISLRFNPIDNLENLEQYVYICAKNRACCICGLPGADIHHVTGSKVGMGNDRLDVDQLGREILPLCRTHHNQCHNDEEKFISKYHIKPIPLTEELIAKLKL